MLRITPSTSPEGAKQYFGKSLTRSDYYIDGQETVGRWGGRAAKALGLTGEVDPESYFALCDNLDPNTGEKLTPRQKSNRRVGYDFTFSAPKSISVLYEAHQDERILDAFRDSVRETMEEAEKEMKTRVRVGGKDEDRTSGNMAWAEFLHFTSRPVDGKPDPHLHAHCFAFNTTFDKTEGRFKAGQFGDLKRDADYFEAAFHARFAKRLNELAYRTERKGTSFTLADLPESLTDRFSRRRNQIEEEARRAGITDAVKKHEIGYYGREHKTQDIGKSELREEWLARLTPEESAALTRVAEGAGNTGGASAMPVQEAMQYAIDHSFERVSTISEKRLKAEALRYGVGSILPEEVHGIAKRADIIAREVDGQCITTTKDVLREEIKMLNFAREGRGQYTALGDADAALPGLAQEQREAALHVLGSQDGVIGIRGGAGTGKTHMMKATIEAIESGKHGGGAGGICLRPVRPSLARRVAGGGL